MSKILSVSTQLPDYKLSQKEALAFMLDIYAPAEDDKKRLELLYGRSGIDYRYSVIPDYSCAMDQRTFYPQTKDLEPFPLLEKRMEWYHPHALKLSADAIRKCVEGKIALTDITHLITVSCTGLSAPGLDLALLEALQLNVSCNRTSVNFMGCYAAMHGLKMADYICKNEPDAKVVVVCTELCSLHFQKEMEMDFVMANLLFGDGAAAVLVTHDSFNLPGLYISGFYSEVKLKGKKDMTWHVSSKGFLMTLSSYIPDLLREDIRQLVTNALEKYGVEKDAVSHWAIHPGGRKILETLSKELDLAEDDLRFSRRVLKDYGNMSSPTVLFVLHEIMKELGGGENNSILAVAFGPGLTMETALFSTCK